ncbi:hypothetical protein DCAR_0728966 [Daucus carota subsp. sativus]|uniref:Water stress and hypersensitive response domain-containing protein n=1 Tax=Daucus carota subsp. sativus TaxID=79200 RepID=A0A164TY03_DAUCS|nr:PREDICTED: desiccation protectant protein Lea14 homolog [Daucus carota subsp. sativus]WOH09509.1 hypothetical protein DCAR_0728966 [Daucus carota subsp. sativus]
MEGLLGKATEAMTKGTKKPEAKITHVGLKDVNLEFVTYNAKISVTNPYPTPLPIFQITYALKSADRELVSGTSPNPEPLKANTTTELEFEMKVSFTMLVSLARDIGADWDIDYDLQINVVGNVPAMGDVTIPISNKGQMKLPTLKDLSALANLTTNLSVTV